MTVALPDLQILVISLEDATFRRRLMAAQLDAPGLPPYAFLDAIDGRQLDSKRKAAIYSEEAAARHGRPLTDPEIGCAASHLLAYQAMVERNVPAALILEDDALLGHQFPQVLARVLPHVDTLSPSAILFSHVGRYSAWHGKRLDKLHRLYRPHAAYGAHAYLINLAGAKSLLKYLHPIHTVADDWQYFGRFRMLDILTVVPYPVGTAPVASTSQIGNERYSAAARSGGLARWLRRYVWQKFLFQILVKPALRLRKQESTW